MTWGAPAWAIMMSVGGRGRSREQGHPAPNLSTSTTPTPLHPRAPWDRGCVDGVYGPPGQVSTRISTCSCTCTYTLPYAYTHTAHTHTHTPHMHTQRTHTHHTRPPPHIDTYTQSPANSSPPKDFSRKTGISPHHSASARRPQHGRQQGCL